MTKYLCELSANSRWCASIVTTHRCFEWCLLPPGFPAWGHRCLGPPLFSRSRVAPFSTAFAPDTQLYLRRHELRRIDSV